MNQRATEMTKEELLTLTDVARLLKRSKSFVFKEWRGWVKEGMRPIRVSGREGGRPLFYKKDIERLLKRWTIV